MIFMLDDDHIVLCNNRLYFREIIRLSFLHTKTEIQSKSNNFIDTNEFNNNPTIKWSGTDNNISGLFSQRCEIIGD